MITKNESTLYPTTNPLGRLWSIIQAERGAYIYLNILYYGLVVLGMIYVTFFNPGLQETLIQAVGSAFNKGPLGAVGAAYSLDQRFL